MRRPKRTGRGSGHGESQIEKVSEKILGKEKRNKVANRAEESE